MELVEVNCAICGAQICVYSEYVKEKMYCTLHCLEISNKMEIVDREITH